MNTSFSQQDNGFSDNELISRINAGEYELFPLLFKRYNPYISYTAKKLALNDSEIEDLIQEGTIALFSAVKSYRSEKAVFSSFASRCIKNAMIDSRRKATSKHKIPDSLFSSLEEVELEDINTPEKIFFDNEAYKSLADSIRLELSPAEYDVLCAFLSGLSYSDIASRLSISVKSVDNSLKRIRTKLKNKKRL